MRYIITAALAATPGLALAEVPRVVTDIPPVHALVAQVMGDLGQPDLLLAKGADEHDFQLRPSQAGAVAEADLVVWIGPELTPWLDSAMDTRPDGAAALALLAAEGTTRRGYADAGQDEDGDEAGHDHADDNADDHADGHADDHADNHAEDHGEDHADHDGHAHGDSDPHAWLDPGNAAVWLGLIAAELSRLDPDNAAAYAANAETAVAGIAALDAELAAELQGLAGRPIVTQHDAYGHFAAHYGLSFVGSVALGDAASPGAARLQDLRSQLEAGEVLCIFPEVQHDPALIEELAEGTGARIGGALDPVGSMLEPGPGAYAALLTGLAGTLVACLDP